MSGRAASESLVAVSGDLSSNGSPSPISPELRRGDFSTYPHLPIPDFTARAQEVIPRFRNLTPATLELFKLKAMGLTDVEVGQQVGSAGSTIKSALAKSRDILRVNETEEAVHYAFLGGFLDIEECAAGIDGKGGLDPRDFFRISPRSQRAFIIVTNHPEVRYSSAEFAPNFGWAASTLKNEVASLSINAGIMGESHRVTYRHLLQTRMHTAFPAPKETAILEQVEGDNAQHIAEIMGVGRELLDALDPYVRDSLLVPWPYEHEITVSKFKKPEPFLQRADIFGRLEQGESLADIAVTSGFPEGQIASELTDVLSALSANYLNIGQRSKKEGKWIKRD